jgi:hypothetical protein
MLISNTNTEITKGQVMALAKWDTTLDGYSGSVRYVIGRQSYLAPITKAEIKELESMGIEAEYIPTEYSGTY